MSWAVEGVVVGEGKVEAPADWPQELMVSVGQDFIFQELQQYNHAPSRTALPQCLVHLDLRTRYLEVFSG